ncbi:Sybindin-like protein [Trichophaea hybrida]|nr:Sybindin-like protein [Trichophaea hybrida]
MVILSILILNKAGGLIYQRDFNEGLKKLSSNDYLVLAGTFHGVHAITSRISPVPGSGGLEVLESDQFRMQCFQTLTGSIKFLIFAEPHQPNIDVICRRVYELYADYVMKNPFYQIEMPIRCESFDKHLAAYIKPKQ